jgi:sulfur carrier protein
VKVWVNGTPRDLGSGATIEAVVLEIAPWQKGVAVALNGQVVPRSAWAGTPLAPDDRVEVLSAVQGG